MCVDGWMLPRGEEDALAEPLRQAGSFSPSQAQPCTAGIVARELDNVPSAACRGLIHLSLIVKVVFVPYHTAGSCCKTRPSSRQGWGLVPRSP